MEFKRCNKIVGDIVDSIKNLLKNLGYSIDNSPLTDDERKEQSRKIAEMKIKQYNNSQGNLNEKDGYNCKTCNNRGDFFTLSEHNTYFDVACKQCDCIKVRGMIKKIKKSGLSSVIKAYTFNNYVPKEKWQKTAKIKATEYSQNPNGNWFYIGGAVGTGKTHICTAITTSFLKRNIAARYMLWRDEIVHLKANITNSEEYERAINELKQTPVLYIDDFFKTSRAELGKPKMPTTAEISIAYEIINYRYMDKKFITIISSEYTIDELLDIDEAVGSRIFERTKENGYCISIDKENGKNYRMGV